MYAFFPVCREKMSTEIELSICGREAGEVPSAKWGYSQTYSKWRREKKRKQILRVFCLTLWTERVKRTRWIFFCFRLVRCRFTERFYLAAFSHSCMQSDSAKRKNMLRISERTVLHICMYCNANVWLFWQCRRIYSTVNLHVHSA